MNIPLPNLRRSVFVLTLAFAGLFAPAHTVHAAANLASPAFSGGDNESVTNKFAVDGTGNSIVFRSKASNLVAGDTNGVEDIFLRNAMTGVTTRLSLGPGKAQANGNSFDPCISADGTKVAFASAATNLVLNDTNGAVDIFLRDLATETTTRISLGIGGVQADAGASIPCLSADGRKLAFESGSSNLVPTSLNGNAQIFVRDLETGDITLISANSAGEAGNGASTEASLNGDGSIVAFNSYATNLIVGTTGGELDIYVRDLRQGTIFHGAKTIDGLNPDKWTYRPDLSDDGTKLVFASLATNLVADTANEHPQIYLRDLRADTQIRVSVNNAGVQADWHCDYPTINGHGNIIAFESYARNLAAGAAVGPQVYLRDLIFRTTTRLSVNSAGQPGNNASGNAALNANGWVITFNSYATNMAPGNTNGVPNVYVQTYSPILTRVPATAAKSRLKAKVKPKTETKAKPKTRSNRKRR